MVAGGLVAMFFTGFASTYIGLPAHVIVASSAVSDSGPTDSIVALILAVLPAIFSSLGIYALVEAAQSMLRYETGVYSSLGIERSTLFRVWMLLFGFVPVASFLLGALTDMTFTPSFVVSLEVLLPIVVSAPLIIIVTAYKIRTTLDSSAYGTMRR